MTYRNLISVSFLHGYYNSGKFRDLNSVPGPDTKRIFQSYGIIHRQSESGFVLLYKADGSNSPLERLREKLQFSIYLTIVTPTFLNFSNIPDEMSGYGFWMTNAKAGKSKLLHSGEFLGNQDHTRFIRSLSEIIDQIPESKEVTLKDMFGEAIFKGTREDFSRDVVTDHLDGSGLFEINVQGNTEKCYFLANGMRRVFGVIDFVIDPSGKAGPSLENISGTEYKIAIEAKPVTWCYNLINRDTSSYSAFKVFAGKEVIPTTDAREKDMINGERAYYIETTFPRQLMERYQGSLELEMTKTEADQSTRKRMSLPFPDVNKIRVERVAGGLRPYSEMYIYF